MDIKKTIKYRTALMAAALVVHCLFVPSASATSADRKGLKTRYGR